MLLLLEYYVLSFFLHGYFLVRASLCKVRVKLTRPIIKPGPDEETEAQRSDVRPRKGFSSTVMVSAPASSQDPCPLLQFLPGAKGK